MKKSFFALAMTIVLGATVLPAQAAGDATVSFTADNKLEYSNVTIDGSSVNLGPAFEGVAPGETRSQTIKVQNENSRTADFYMSAEAVEALERNTETARGAGYEMKLTAGDTVLYDSTVGGYSASNEAAASQTGIEGMNNALEDYILIATLENGESINVVLTIKFDGEAMDNTTAIDYSWTEGQLAFEFKVGYEDPTGITTVYKEVTRKGGNKLVEILEGAVPLDAVATGDAAMIGIGVVVLVAGIMLVFFGKRRKTEE